MTDQDVLKRASEALRDQTVPSAAELARLRERVLKGNVSQLRPTNHAKRLRWILPLAAALLATTALAATPGAMQGVLHAVERFLDIQLIAPAPEPAQTARHAPVRGVRKVGGGSARAPEAVAEPEGPEEAAPSDVATNEAASPENVAAPAASSARVNAATPAPRRTASKPPSSHRLDAPASESGVAPTPSAEAADPKTPGPAAQSRDLALYRAAHELHFRERRYQDALRAWEDYLRFTPAPTFELEARYNRALCLLHLGHYEEARAALAPFAQGKRHGGYRREEATRLIEALDQRR